MTLFEWLLVGGTLFGCVGVYSLARERAAQTWPSIPAQVMEMPAQTFFEKFSSSTWVLNTDTDHFLVWTVNGEEYRKRLEDKSAIHVAGFKVWRRPPEVGDVVIRYNPKSPGKCFTPEDAGIWKWVMAISVLLFSGAAYVFYA